MILIFAGAGASAAVSSKDYPTTVEFYNRLDNTIKSVMDAAVNGSLKAQIDIMGKESSPVDIEQILWTINRALQHVAMCSNKNDVVGRGLYNLGWRVETTDWKEELSYLQDQIHQEVYRLYAKPPTKKQMEIWINLLRSIGESILPIEIFTTNYDLVLENVIRELGPIKIETGFYLDGSNRSVLNKKYLNFEYGKDDTIGKFVKLHGSVNWHREEDNIVSGISKFTGSHSNHAILYPGFKGFRGMPEAEDNIFKEFYNHLAKICKEVKLAIFIGFSFRDSEINDILGSHIPVEAMKIIINKEKADKTFHGIFPFDKERCVHTGDGFSSNSVDGILKIIATTRDRGFPS